MATGPAPDPLAELRDIHLPAPLEFWPPAAGWWLLAALALAGTIYGIYLLVRAWRSNAYRRQAVVELADIFANSNAEAQTQLANINELLKRVALSRFPREHVANLSGESWVAFLDQAMGGHEFTMGPGQILIDGPYAIHGANKENLARLEPVVRRWIQTHKVVTS